MARASKPRYVDVSNPGLVVECPRCGLLTARFIDLCRNCGYKLWPSSEMASAAFKAWQEAEPVSRSDVSRFDLSHPTTVENLVDYDARAHQLGIHVFPSSNWPFIICVGAFFLGLAAVPWNAGVRIGSLVIGGIIFITGVAGWVLVEDVRLYPADSPGGEAHH